MFHYFGHHYPYISVINYELMISNYIFHGEFPSGNEFPSFSGRMKEKRCTTLEASFLGGVLLVLHANQESSRVPPLSNPSSYIHCFYLETVNPLLTPGQKQKDYEMNRC